MILEPWSRRSHGSACVIIMDRIGSVRLTVPNLNTHGVESSLRASASDDGGTHLAQEGQDLLME